MSQTEAIKRHLERGRPITPLQALYRFGCFRLGARIWELRQAGMKITRKMITVKTRNGEATVAQYRRTT